MRIDSKTTNRLAVVFLMVLLSVSVPARAHVIRHDSQQLTDVLGEARDEAAELARDADETEPLTRSEASWRTHAEMLDRVKDHVNNMARIINKLTDTRTSGSELQEQAVDRILPLLAELAANTTAAINYLNQNKNRPVSASYAQYLHANVQTAHQLADTVASLFEYEKSMTELAKLKDKLQLNNQ